LTFTQQSSAITVKAWAMFKPTAQPCALAEVLPEVDAIPAVSQATLLVLVLLLALPHHQCVVVVAVLFVVLSEEAFEAALLAPMPIVRRPATNVVGPITMLATAKLRP
jgi:hypothetical protein